MTWEEIGAVAAAAARDKSASIALMKPAEERAYIREK